MNRRRRKIIIYTKIYTKTPLSLAPLPPGGYRVQECNGRVRPAWKGWTPLMGTSNGLFIKGGGVKTWRWDRGFNPIYMINSPFPWPELVFRDRGIIKMEMSVGVKLFIVLNKGTFVFLINMMGLLWVMRDSGILLYKYMMYIMCNISICIIQR